MATGNDLFAPSAGLDASEPVAGTDLFADPNAPGPLKKGIKTSVAGIKAAAGGATALVGDLIGNAPMKQAGLDYQAEKMQEAGQTTMRVEDIESIGGAVDFTKYGVGYLVPQLITALAAGVIGRAGGALAARGLANPAAALAAKNAGMTAGLATSAIAQEAGAIYPEAVEAGLPDAAARAVIGGTAAGALDVAPQLLAAKMFGLLGKRVTNPGKALDSFLVRGVKGATAGAGIEAATEGAQTAIERLAVSKSLRDPEAMSEYLNAVALGAIGGGVVGGPIGALARPGEAPAPAAAPAAPAAAPAAAPTVAAPAAAPQAPAAPTFASFPAAEAEIVYTPESYAIVDQIPGPTELERAQSRLDEVQARAAALVKETATKERTKEQIAKERKAALAEAEQLTQRVANLKALAETPEYQFKGTTEEPVILGAQPAPTAPARPIMTLDEEALLQQAEQEAINAARQGSFKGSVRQERGEGTVSGQAAGSSVGNRVQREAQGAGSQGSVEARLAQIKRARGLLLSADEAKILRDLDAAQPGLQIEPTRARETVRQITPEQRREAFIDAYERGTNEIFGGFAQRGSMKPERAAGLSSRVKTALREVLAAHDADATSAAIGLNERISTALKGKMNAPDVETFKQELAAFIARAVPAEAGVRNLRDRVVDVSGEPRQQTLFSKAASSGLIEFTHWGDVPGGVTNPEMMGTGKRGADWQPAATFGLKYTSAVVKGTPFRETGITERQQYEGTLRADKVYRADAADPLLAEARVEVQAQFGAPNSDLAHALYAKKIAERGYDAMLYPEGQLRIFTPQAVKPVFAKELAALGVPEISERTANLRAMEAHARHMETGGSTTFVATGRDGTGMNAYAVSIYKDREVQIVGQPTARQIADYIRVNDDLLSDPTNALGTWFDPESGITYLDISKTVPHMHTAMRLARENDQIAFFDLRTLTNIPLGHPLFDIAQEYNRMNDMPPVVEVEYIDWPAGVGKQIARAFDNLKPFNDTPAVRDAFAAMAAEEKQQFDLVSKFITIEPWTQEGQPYKNSAEMRSDVFGRNHLYVFQGGETHPLRSPEEVFRGRAVHDLFGHARTGFEFGARGELNATRVHAQMYSERALPALISDNIGQNAWVNFSDVNEGLPQAQRRFADQKVDLLPESLWRPLLDHSLSARYATWDQRDAVLEDKGTAVLDYLDRVLGSPSGLTISLVEEMPEGVGRIQLSRSKALIELALSAKDVLSVAAHEGYHYLEQRALTASENEVVRRAFERGTPLHAALIEKTRAYDRANGTNLTEEVMAAPVEARAYGFEFWRRGELTATGPLERIFQKLKQIIERIANFLDGAGFTSYEDIFRAVERGEYARRSAQGMRSGTVPQSYLEAIEPDAIPGTALLFRNRKEAKQSKGRPEWIKTPAHLRKMRAILKHLAVEGGDSKDWYRRSAQAILRWAEGDKQRAAKLAALVAMYSPRTPVGLDLRHAIQHFAQWEAGVKIDAGGTNAQREYGTKILEGTGYKDERTGYTLPGRPDAPKINSFFKNLMMTIDPVAYPTESQDSTIDMWMSHIFGFGDKTGKISDANYWWADAEIKRLAREMMLQPDQVQAAIWVAVKARGNMVRGLARKQGIEQGWFRRVAIPKTDQKDLFGGGAKARYELNPKHEFKYMVNWIRLALAAPFSKPNFDAANYSYAEAMRDVADGTNPLNRLDFDFEIEAGLFDDIANGKVEQGTLQFYSRAASLADMARRVREGEAPRSQLNGMWADAIDSQPNDAVKEKMLGLSTAELQGMGGSFKRFYSEHLSSGLNLARASEGYKNVFNVLTAFTQRKSRLIANAVENQLSEWVGPKAGSQHDKQIVSHALLQRTENAWETGSPEFNNLRLTLTEKQRAMFDQATRMIANQLDAEFRAEQAAYRRLFANDEQYAQWYTNRATQIERLKKEGYFPERRFGDHAVHAYVTGPDGKKITAYYSLHEREADAREELARIKEAIGEGQGIEFEYGFKYRADYDASLSFGKFLDIAQRHGISLTQAEKERIGKALIAADNTRRNRVFRRKNIAGYSEDGLRILAEFGVTTANKVAYAELGDAINQSLDGREVNVRFDERGNVEINTYERDMWALDGEKAGFYRNLADSTAAFTLSPRDTNPASRFLRTAASAHFLGGSVAAAMVNMTSLPMNTIPWLTQHTSYTDAFTKVVGGAKLAGQHLQIIRDLPRLLDQTVRMEGVDEVDGLRRALQIAAQDGTVLDTEIYQIMGLARGQEYSLTGRVQSVVSAWMLPFRLAEQFNRVSTFIAAYKIAKEKNLSNDAAYKLAQDTVYSTQFRYDEANRPALARGNIGSLMFVFKTYPIFATELMVYLAREKPQAAVFMMLSYVMMAGIEGLPFAEDMEDLIDTIAQRVFGSPFNSRRALRNVLKSASEAVVGADMSSVLVHGLANELTGLSFASRVGLGNLIPGTRFGTAEADYARTMSEIVGPVGALTVGALKGLDSMTRGNWEQGARQFLPLAGQNLVKAWGQWEKGYATDIGGRKLVDVAGHEAFFQALGFSPASLAKAYDADAIDRQTSSFYQQVKTDIQNDLIKAVRDGRTADADAIVAAIGTWNEAYPDMPMAVSPASVRRQIALAGMPLNERTLARLPRALRGSSESAIGLED